jgi:hypothetical protein
MGEDIPYIQQLKKSTSPLNPLSKMEKRSGDEMLDGMYAVPTA